MCARTQDFIHIPQQSAINVFKEGGGESYCLFDISWLPLSKAALVRQLSGMMGLSAVRLHKWNLSETVGSVKRLSDIFQHLSINSLAISVTMF